MATTRFVGESERAKGFAGRVKVAGVEGEVEGWWM